MLEALEDAVSAKERKELSIGGHILKSSTCSQRYKAWGVTDGEYEAVDIHHTVARRM